MKKNLLPILAAWVHATISCAQGIDGSWHGNLDFGGQKLGIFFISVQTKTANPREQWMYHNREQWTCRSIFPC